MNLCAATLAGAGLAQLTGWNAATEIHLPGVAVAPDFDIEFLRERVDAADADTMKTAGDFIGGGVELATRVQLCEHHLHRGHALATGQIHHVHGNTTAIVDDSDGIVDVDDDFDLFGVAGESFVDGIVYDLVDEVMQSHLTRGPDVHCGTEANGFKAFQDLDVFAGVAVVIAVHGGRTQNFSRHKIPFARCSVMSWVSRG